MISLWSVAEECRITHHSFSVSTTFLHNRPVSNHRDLPPWPMTFTPVSRARERHWFQQREGLGLAVSSGRLLCCFFSSSSSYFFFFLCLLSKPTLFQTLENPPHVQAIKIHDSLWTRKTRMHAQTHANTSRLARVHPTITHSHIQKDR